MRRLFLMLKDGILKFLKLDGFVQLLTDYLETRVELLKIEVREDIAKALSRFSLAFILIVAFLLFLVFTSVAMAVLIGQSIGMVYGFLLVALVYLVMGIVLLVFREALAKNLEKKFLDIAKKK